MGSEVLPKSASEENIPNPLLKMLCFVFFCFCVGAAYVVFFVFALKHDTSMDLVTLLKEANHVPDITIQSMDFAVLNVTETRLTMNWDLLIRIPSQLPGYYMCLKGDFQAFILYKGVTIATSPKESYNLIPRWPQQLIVSTIGSKVDMDPATVKDIMEVIKDKGEIRFGSRLTFPDCRYGTSGKMKYDCDEATLQFGPGSQTNATLFRNQLPNCPLITTFHY